MALSDKLKQLYSGVENTLVDTFGQEPSKFERVVDKTLGEMGRGQLRLGAATVSGGIKLGRKIQAALDPFSTFDDYEKKYGTSTITPENDFEKNLFGTDEALTFRRAGGELPFVDEKGAFAPALGLGMGVLDLVPGGKPVKQSLILGAKELETVLKTKNVKTIKNILLTSGKVATEDADAVAQALKFVDNEKDFTRVTRQLIERGFVKSVRQVAPNATKVAGQYIPRSTDDLAQKAANLVREDQSAAEALMRAGNDENAVAVASELVKKYSDDAAKAAAAGNKAQADMLYDRLAEMVNPFAEKLTGLGRAVQAASILGRATPEGQLRFAAKTIQKWNEANPLKKIPELSGEDAKWITDEMRAVNQMEDGVEKAVRLKKVQDFITDKVPTPLWKKMTTIWKAGLLTGIKTSGLNIASNASHGVLETIKDIPAAAVDSVAALFTGKRAKMMTLRGAGGGVQEGFKKGWTYLRKGVDERNLGEKLDYTKVNFGKGPVAKFFQTYTDTVFRVIGSQDQPFYYGAAARSIGDQALTIAHNVGLRGDAAKEYAEEIMKNPTTEMVNASVIDATTAVFQNDTEISKRVGKIREAGGFLGEIIIPFNKTPSAVAMQILNYSPVGIVRAVVENMGKGKFNQRQFSTMMGRGITGTVPMYIGYELFNKDMVQLEYPESARERALYEAEGRKDNSIKINGKWRDPIVLGPAGNLILMGAYYARGLKESGSPSAGMAQGLKTAGLGTLSAIKEQTFLSGINNFMNAFDDPVRNGERYIQSLAASTVPTLSGDIARAIDGQDRRTTGGFAEKTVQGMEAKIPGLRENLEPKVDVLGRDISLKAGPWEIMLDPTRPQKGTETPVTKELRRLMNEGYTVSPTKLGKSKDGFPVLTPEQNTEMWQQAGKLVNQKLTNLMLRKEYTMANDEERGKAIDKIVDQSKITARALMVIELTDGLTGQALVQTLKNLKDGGLLTNDVLRRAKELQ